MLFDEILLSVGCSTIPTVVTAYLIDQASEKRNARRIKELRDHFLWGMPHGLLWIMKIIVEFYIPFNDSDGEKSLNELFCESIRTMENKTFDRGDIFTESNEIKELLANHNLGYGIALCCDQCKSILSHDYELEINNVFSKEELLAISYLLDECIIIQKTYRLCEMAELIRIFVKNTIEKISEIKEKASRFAVLKNRRINNWPDISI